MEEYKYNSGDIIKTKNGKIQILEQTLLKRSDNTYRKGYEIKCLIDGYIYNVTESHLNSGNACPVCSNRITIKDINSVWKTDNDKAINFANIEDSYTKSRQSSFKVWIKCPRCSNLKYMAINHYINYGIACPYCSDGKSYSEKFMFNILTQLKVSFECEYAPKWCEYKINATSKQGRYDFYFEFNNKKYIIEMDGGLGHGKKENLMTGQTIKESKYIDDCKDKLANEHEIEVIRVNCNYPIAKYRYEFIKDSIMNNKRLYELFDFRAIDWIKCNEFSLNSMIMVVRDLWNKGFNKQEIMQITNLSDSCVQSYLKKISKFNLGYYDPKEEMKKNGRRNGKATGKKVYCNELDKTFNSLHDCSKYFNDVLGLKLTVNGIGRVCRGLRNHHKNYTFMYL